MDPAVGSREDGGTTWGQDVERVVPARAARFIERVQEVFRLHTPDGNDKRRSELGKLVRRRPDGAGVTLGNRCDERVAVRIPQRRWRSPPCLMRDFARRRRWHLDLTGAGADGYRSRIPG